MGAIENIEKAKKDFLSSDLEVQRQSSMFLIENKSEDVSRFFMPLLNNPNARFRNRAALAIRDMGDNSALDALINSIQKKEHFNHNGTLVYALQTLDYSKKLRQLFEILFYQSWDAKRMVCIILDDQLFEFTQQDLLDVELQWQNVMDHPDICPEYNSEYE